MISGTKPIFNLKILTLPNPDLSDLIEIGKTYIQFNFRNTGNKKSIFLNLLIQNMIIEWYET
jgi:hypothetical protein